MSELHLELPIGLPIGGTYRRDVELLRTNGVAEKVFTKKSAEKPYTWIANVISIAVKHIGGIEIGQQAREEYVKGGNITHSKAVLSLPLGDSNSLLLEIHRKVWQNIIPKQDVLCKFCAKKLVMDIDLDQAVLSEENQDLIAEVGEFHHLVVDLRDGYQFQPLKAFGTKKDLYTEYEGKIFNRLVYRIPTLGDAIRNEKYASDTVVYWRRLAFDCLVAVQEVNGEEIICELPKDFNTFLGLKLYDEILSSKDLKLIREKLREYLPTLPFGYFTECPCPSQREIPVVMEASSFFSE